MTHTAAGTATIMVTTVTSIRGATGIARTVGSGGGDERKDKKGERMLLLNDPKSEEKIHLWLEVS